MLRYIRKLSDKDIALDRAMIPLGSCTMKLNSTSEMIPVGWDEFSNIHPFAPDDQTGGYKILIKDYPNTDFALDAKYKLDLIDNILASKEIYIGKYSNF